METMLDERRYVVIIENVRGRFASEGEWYPFKNESNDGYDTVEWTWQGDGTAEVVTRGREMLWA